MLKAKHNKKKHTRAHYQSPIQIPMCQLANTSKLLEHKCGTMKFDE